MKKYLLFLWPILMGSVGLTLVKDRFALAGTATDAGATASAAIGCAPGAEEGVRADPAGKYIPILPGWGHHSHPVTTTSDSAQRYFNQGLSMYYSYHMTEAIASFKEAARFDSSCGMAYWGQALAMGPTYNGGYDYKMGSGVAAAIRQMNKHASGLSPKEKALVAAMNTRYLVDDRNDGQRAWLNEAYAGAMKAVLAQYPDDVDVNALYTDAVMLLHAWDFWYNDGTPKPWTPELMQHCRYILEKDPRHPAGHHYFIHITEASRHPQIALASADSLGKLFPGIAHMVHMSSHEYERIGYYAKGVASNEAADKSLGRYASMAKNLDLAPHVSHYYAVDAYCALSGAMAKKAGAKAKQVRSIVRPTYHDTYSQYLYTFPLLAAVRMGQWQQLLNNTETVNSSWTYAGLLQHFARGMAYAKTGDFANAEKQLGLLKTKQQDTILRVRFRPYMSSPYDCSRIAAHLLQATIAFGRKNDRAAFIAIDKAISAEDSLLYSEPNIWMLPARQHKGAFLLKRNRPAEAEAIFREDLVLNPGNGWSLVGLYGALSKQQKTGELSAIKAQYLHSFSGAEQVPLSSAY